MSFDYRGCFILGDAIDASALQASLGSYGLAFAGSHASLVYNQGRTLEEQAPSRDWAAFVADANGPSPSAYGQLQAEEFWFDFGFVGLPGLLGTAASGIIRAAWLEISEQKLYDMSLCLGLEEPERNPLQFFVSLFKALNAQAMAFGRETTALQFLQFFAGELTLREVDDQISTAIAPPPASAEAMRKSPWLRELDIDGVHVLTRYISGLEEYFENGGG